ncbi:hypothetical protein WJX72_006790 [[Myrmecia] bisecta]|uniref:Uncharacterized protein n=1 Tax=[Myrmecia] bisecta TaxID=41462 RepID=A0AAW1QRA9_9CHLO
MAAVVPPLQLQVLHALQALHAPGRSAVDTRTASDWLTQFQHSQAAWQVCIDCLQDMKLPFDVHLFAAQTLRQKLRRQLGSLPAEAWPWLRAALLACAVTYSSSPPLLIRQLCLALAALVVHWDGWTDALQQLGSRLSASSMLTFLTELPDECLDERGMANAPPGAAFERHVQAKCKVRSWSQAVIDWLKGMLAARDSSVGDTRAAVLDCFGAWVRLGGLYEVPLDAAQPLIAAAFECSCSQQYGSVEIAGFQVANAVIDHAPEALQPYLLSLVAQLPQQASQAIAHGSADAAEALCAIFACFVIANMPLCASASEQGHSLRDGLLTCATIPSGVDHFTTSGEPVAASALEAWQAMAEYLVEINTALDTEAEHLRPMSPVERVHWFQLLLRRLLPMMSAQPDSQSPAEALLPQEDEPGRQLQAYARDMLQACCRVLGAGAYLAVVVGFSAQEAGSWLQWGRVQVALFCLEAASEVLSEAIQSEADPTAGAEVATTLLHFFTRLIHEQAGPHSTAAKLVRHAVLQPLAELISPLMHYMATARLSAQELLHFTLSQATQSLLDGVHPQTAARAVLQACKAAVEHAVPVTWDIVLALLRLVQSAPGPEVEADLVVAISHCLPAGRATHDVGTRAAVEVFAGCWLPLAEALLAPAGGLIDLRADAAKCLTLAMRADAAGLEVLLPQICSVAAKCIGLPGGHVFGGPLGLAAELAADPPGPAGLQAAVGGALQVVSRTPMIQELGKWQAGDESPELAQAVLNLTAAVARHCQSWSGDLAMQQAVPFLQEGLGRAAACATCNHKDVAAAAMSCLATLIGACSEATPFQEPMLLAVWQAGPTLLQGLLCALLGPFALARVHKAVTILTDLAALPAPSGMTGPAASGGSSFPNMQYALPDWLSRALHSLPAGRLQDCHAVLLLRRSTPTTDVIQP